MNKALLWIGGLFLLLLSALFTVPRVVDWNSYRGVFEEEASRMLGRQVRVGGAVAVRLLPSPYVRFEQLRIADTTGTLGEPFFRADNFTMGLSIAPMLRGAVEATSVVVEKPVLTLAIDPQGRGNWRDFKVASGALPFIPADVSLQEVTIKDGLVTVRAGNGSELVRLETITGAFSADSLEGPYKFRGTTRWGGQVRDVSLSTARPDADGGTRFKAFVRSGESGARYTVEATALDLATRPRISGDLVAKVPFRAAGSKAAGTARGSAAGVDLKSKLYADTAGASLSDLALSFDQGDQPQLVTGEALASWLAGTRIKVKLSSLWLDLDRLARGALGQEETRPAETKAKAPAEAAPEHVGPARAVRALVPELVAVLPRSASTEVEVTVEQVNLGGEVASNVMLSFVRGEGPMQLRALKAGLPGGAQIDLTGTLKLADKSEAFTGNVGLHGTSVSRFLAWVLQRPSGIEQRSDGAFSLQGRIALDGNGFDIADATSEIFGTPLAGALNYRWQGRRSARLLLEGPRIDVGAILPGVLSRLAIVDMLRPASSASETRAPAHGGQAADAAGASAGDGWLADLGDTDVYLRVRAGEVTDKRNVLRDVDADLSLVNAKLTLSGLGLTTAEGLRVELEGDLTGLSDAPKGTLRGMVGATSPRALSGLLDALGLADGINQPVAMREARLASLVPLRLAGTLHLEGRGKAANLTLDGAVRGGRTRTSVKLDGGLDGWRKAPVDLALTLEDAGTGLALAELLFGRTQRLAAIDAAALGKGEVVIRARGTPDTSLLALASVRTEALHLDYDGTARLPASGPSEIAGTARMSAERAAPVLTLAGLAGASALADAPIVGQLAFTAKGPALEIRPRGLQIAGTPLDGVLRLAATADGRQSIDANLTIPTADVAGLMTAVLRSGTETGAIPAPVSLEAARQVWPDKPFGFSAFERLEGRIHLGVKTLVLADGLRLADAVLTAKVAPERVEIEALKGRAAGGAFTASLTLAKATAGANVSGRIALDGARLDALAGIGTASGSGSFDVTFAGRALSPRSLVTVATGKGEARLVNASVRHFATTAIDRTSDAVLAGEVAPTIEAIRDTIRRLLATQSLALGSRRVPIAIVDGAARVARVGFETREAKGSIETTIDLATLAFDSDWRLVSKTTVPATETRPLKPPLPEISVVYVGALGAIAAVEPRIGVDALEREIAVRKMERDVEELERLRRLDEEAAKAEAERQRQLEAAARAAEEARRAAAAAASAAPPNGGPAVSPPPLVPPVPVPATPPAASPTTTPATTPGSNGALAPPAPQPQSAPAAPGATSQLRPAGGPAQDTAAGTVDPQAPAEAPKPPRVTRKSAPPATKPFRPFDRSVLPQ